MNNDVAIQIEGLYKIFGSRPQKLLEKVKNNISKTDLLENHNHVLALNNINLTIRKSQVSVIMGLSGSGKSTLIRHINRLIEPTAGKIIVYDDDITSFSKKELLEFRRHRASMVFQKFGLHIHKTVAENIAYGLIVQGVKKKKAIRDSRHWLERVGLSGFENSYPSALSGGMQQRVGLARALATNSDILLMDEPFSALDPLIRSEMQNILLELQEELNKTIVFITHDLDEALRIGNTISILRDGAIIQTGIPKEIILNPKDEYIIDFVKDINKGRVIKIRVITVEKKREKAQTLPADLALEDALEALVAIKEQYANVVDNNHVIGSITLAEVVQAMTKTRKTSENYA